RLDRTSAGILHHWSGVNAFIADLDPRDSCTAELLDEERNVIELLSRIGGLWRDKAADGIAARRHFAEYTGIAILEDFRAVLKKNIEASIRLVAAIPFHRFLKTQPR